MRRNDLAAGPVARGPNAFALVAAAVAFSALAARTAATGWRLPVLAAIGVALGITLYHARFGFTAAYRRFILQRDVSGVLAQCLMLAVATVLFAPVLASGSAFGQQVVAAAPPVGWQVAIGAFLFGIGMQLAGGCGSGTLYTVGGGSPRMVVTLVAFCTGGFLASLHLDWWGRLPWWAPGALGERLGWPVAAALNLAVIGLLAAALVRLGKTPVTLRLNEPFGSFAAGPWPLVAGALALAALNFATLLVAGYPWTITWAFTLWGAKAAVALGWNPESSAFWQAPFQSAALESSVFDDVTSVMDLGIVIGALAAAAAAGRFAPRFRISARAIVAASLGGLLMGYGARLAFGCNVGAFFSGVASTSLHGWLWIAAALPGNWVGVRLRPLFALDD